MKMRLGRWKWLGVVGATLPLWIPAFAGMTNSVAGTIHPGSEFGTFFRTNRSCRRAPAHHGMKTEALIGGGIRVAFVPRLRPLDSGFRRKDEVGGRYDVASGGNLF